MPLGARVLDGKKEAAILAGICEDEKDAAEDVVKLALGAIVLDVDEVAPKLGLVESEPLCEDVKEAAEVVVALALGARVCDEEEEAATLT